MVIGIYSNKQKDECRAYAQVVTDWLHDKGIQPVTEGHDLFYEANFWVVLGGDGTMLRASHIAAPLGIALLGINVGLVGYLTDADRQEGLLSLDKVIRGEFIKENRSMLSVECTAKKTAPVNASALNEIYISGYGKMIGLSISVNGFFMEKIRADGLIVATPTGSTAHNLSAGGPILKPDGNMTVITAVCPHAHRARPWIIDAEDTVEVTAEADVYCNPQKINVVVDGENIFEISDGDKINITKSKFSACIIKTNNIDFFSVLRKKMILNP
ncbi:MAG: NAD(+)/NADH kinase [Defluviitaleaceae bacterium]|nr:NAD(+)/NADH kinase [Defluviitaleaceae bacterium]